MKPLIIIDVDGTITDFKQIDHEIISLMYEKNKFVIALDKLLWRINGLDYFTNKFWIFKFRIFLYSILSLSNYKFNMIKYQKNYVAKTRQDFNKYFDVLHPKIEKMGYETLLLSHDRFAGNVSNKIICVRDKKRYVLDNVYSSYDVIYVIGNNYMDDIKLGLKLQKLNNDLDVKIETNIVYVGTSRYLIEKVLINKSVKCVNTFEKFVYELEKE